MCIKLGKIGEMNQAEKQRMQFEVFTCKKLKVTVKWNPSVSVYILA